MPVFPDDSEAIQPGETIRSVFIGPLNRPEVGVQVMLVRTDDAGKTHYRHLYPALASAGDDLASVAAEWASALVRGLSEEKTDASS